MANQKVLNKSLVRINFSNNPELNLSANDMTEALISYSVEDKPFEELKGAMMTIMSANFFGRARVSININRLSSKCQSWTEQVIKNAFLEGSASVVLDNGFIYTLNNLMISFSEATSDGKTAEMPFELAGDLQFNTELKK